MQICLAMSVFCLIGGLTALAFGIIDILSAAWHSAKAALNTESSSSITSSIGRLTQGIQAALRRPWDD